MGHPALKLDWTEIRTMMTTQKLTDISEILDLVMGLDIRSMSSQEQVELCFATGTRRGGLKRR